MTDTVCTYTAGGETLFAGAMAALCSHDKTVDTLDSVLASFDEHSCCKSSITVNNVFEAVPLVFDDAIWPSCEPMGTANIIQ